jgi:neutral ceramidase
MKSILCVAVVLAASSAAARVPAEAGPSEPEMQAGVAVADITPPVGWRMSGYFYERLSTGVHDPLQAKAIVLCQGSRRAALVFCDLIGVPLELSRQARLRAEQQTGVPAPNILIAATHSHTGPLYFGALRQRFHDQAVAKEGRDPQETVDYSARLVESIAGVIGDAQAACRPVKLQVGVAQQLGLSFNRRFHMKDGSVRFNPGKLNPDIVRPAGPIDPDVGILLFCDQADNRPTASLTVFAMHLDTVGGTLFSADYPYYLEQLLRGKLGEGFVSLFGLGTCGDINHIDVSHGRPQNGQQEAKRIGEALAATVAPKLAGLKEVKHPSLLVRHEIVHVPLQQFSREEIAWAREALGNVGNPNLPFLEQVKAYKIVACQMRGGAKLPLPVQVIRFSPQVALVALPGEVFVELGLAIKRASPFETTLVVELAHDAPGYVPTRKAFAEGSYETVNSRIQPGGGELLVETAVRLLKEIRM